MPLTHIKHVRLESWVFFKLIHSWDLRVMSEVKEEQSTQTSEGTLGPPGKPDISPWSGHSPGLQGEYLDCSSSMRTSSSPSPGFLLQRKNKSRENGRLQPQSPGPRRGLCLDLATCTRCPPPAAVATRSPRPALYTGCHPFSSIPGLHFFNYPLSPTLSIFSSLWDHSHLFINMLSYLPLTKRKREIQRKK